MKKNQSIFMIGVSMLLLVVAGCSKDKNGGPEDERTVEQLRTEITGKWTIRNFPAGVLATSSKPSSQLRAKTAANFSRQLLKAGLPLILAETGGSGSSSAFVEFLPDGTYLVQDAQGNTLSGGYVVKSGQSIDLSGFGSISEIKFSGDRIDFKIQLFTSSSLQTLEISANKAPEVPASDRTSLLTRTWNFVSEEDSDGETQYMEDEMEVDFDDDRVIIIDQLKVTFSKSGTYAIRYFYKGAVIAAETANWRWSPSDDNKFEYAWDNDSFDEEDSATILTLTTTDLVIKEEWRWEDEHDYTITTLKVSN